MSVEEAPRTVRQRIDEALEEVSRAARSEEVDLPAMLGEYRAVEGRPGWYLRPMRLRQQLRMAHLQSVVQETTEGALRGHVTIAALLLYRVSPPGDDLTGWASRVLAGTAFEPANEDEILDTFSLDELNREVLQPMRFGWDDAPAEAPQEGNA